MVAYELKPNGKNAEVGIDLGLKEGMTLSTGAKIENSRMFARYEDALRCARACRQEASHKGNPRQDRQQPKGLPPQGDNEDRRRLQPHLRRASIGPLAAGDERRAGIAAAISIGAKVKAVLEDGDQCILQFEDGSSVTVNLANPGASVAVRDRGNAVEYLG